MKISEMEAAINEAQAVLRRADMCATRMARLIKGRLRQVDGGWNNGVLKDLKKELQDFNASTGQSKN